MRRRALLTTIGATVTATAGCLSDGPATGGPATDSDTDTDEPTTSDDATDTRSPTDEPATPVPASDTFADYECPSFAETERTICYHTADVASAPLVLAAEPEVFDPETTDDAVATIEFTLYNRSEWPVGFNPYDWEIHRYDDGEWTHVAPEITPEPWTSVQRDETFTWALPTGPTQSPNDEDHQPVGVALDPGVYAFHVTVPYEDRVDEDETPADPPTGHTELIALFEVAQAIASESTTASPSI